MKYFAILAFAIGVLAIPQDASVTSAPTSSAIPGLTPSVSCAMACKAGDVDCQAACLGNARPNASQAIATNECAAKCDQGSGSTEDTKAFAKCVDACINSLFPSSQTAFAPGGAAASNAASASGTNAANPTASAGSRATNSASGTGASSPQSTGAADSNSARMAGAGLAGLLAIFAL
ncbi:uncharacterized protein K460DRAFT_360130 [Cucurbitaria berberidis CBS 394.84]|uniref:Extracellular membrane protein CFEM domain-containing protein n=1 Tax=Cucurbitaria berberidis CBS 394.84 TaxID=1168544 RepID=A0A9P4L329_9PLEO|nr:uncharacterized protein K460DRAFT_360130 [Cucurbitaria berberidis CBS 394.84]KAF1840456.1 hypothetical protein K460DRAFT_360130 [Cucurbitaria berberidis CBS 394.84]